MASGSYVWTQLRASSPGLILVLGPAPFSPWVSERKQGPSAPKHFVQGSSLSLWDEEPHCLWRQANHGTSWPPNRDAQNLLEAASSGAAVSVKLVANIGANLIAFLALLAFINAALSWLGAMVGVQELSFQV